MLIGVLALQGAFQEHKEYLTKLGVDVFEIRNKDDINRPFSGLVLPGGESTAIGKLLHTFDLYDILKEKIQSGLPVLGTCAGLILLAKKLSNDTRTHFGLLDVIVKRNAYGRQLSSFSTIDNFKGIGKIPMVFIRGPIIDSVGENVEILSIVNGDIVAVREKNMLALSYHPELTNDLSVHKYFINNMCSENKLY